MKTALASHGHSLGEMAASQERHLSDQSEAVKTWSRDQNKLVQQVNTRVDQFLLEDLKDDLPTGLLCFFSQLSLVCYSSFRIDLTKWNTF